MRRAVLVVLAVTAPAAAVSACGDDVRPAAAPRSAALTEVAATAAAAPATASAARPTVQARRSRFGRVLFDGRGFALYVFTRDPRGRSACDGACAKAWPPLIVRGRPAAGPGTRRGLLGTTRRKDGRRQATYAGRPLYFYVGDTRPGQISCQDIVEFGGTWLVQSPAGAPVRSG